MRLTTSARWNVCHDIPLDLLRLLSCHLADNFVIFTESNQPSGELSDLNMPVPLTDVRFGLATRKS
jgi:hypothetical protein